MGPTACREYIADVRPRYAAAGTRAERSRILDAVVAATGYHRKYAIALLGARPRPRKKRARTGPRCGLGVAAALVVLWRSAGYPWSVRLRAMIPLWLPALLNHHRLSESEREALRTMSARTMDRVLKAHRGALRTRLYGRTKPGALLKHQIPIRSERWDVAEPGWCEIDSVAHCGPLNGGDFVWSVNLTDIATGWTQTLAVQGKSQRVVVAALEEMRTSLPFGLRGIDSDTGSEFINAHCANWCTQNAIVFTRSRPYRKNDNAHIEQKNFTHVRKIFGYKRLDGETTVEAMNALYRAELCRWLNFFQPSVKLVKKERVGARVRRHYGDAMTPLDRLAALNTDVQELLEARTRLDPIALGKQIDKAVAAILALPVQPGRTARTNSPHLRALSHRQVLTERVAKSGTPVRSNAAR